MLIRNDVERVLVVGGTATIGDPVVAEVAAMAEVQRMAGANRFGTAFEVAKATTDARGTGAQASTLVDGIADGAWVGGFAVASVSAARNAPSSSARARACRSRARSTPETLGPERLEASTAEVMLCIVNARTCELGRRRTGLPPAPLSSINPENGATVASGSNVLTASTRPPWPRTPT